MKWAHFLHMYQPYDQDLGTLEKIVNQSYRPMIRGFTKYPKTRITLNISAVLTELLYLNGYRDVIENIKMLVEMGRVELVGTSKYHAFLPLIPSVEVERQINLNHETNKLYFGDHYNPKGFFSPEMGYTPKVLEAAKKTGHEWMFVDESAICDDVERECDNSIYIAGDSGFKLYVREKVPSNMIMGALVRGSETLIDSLNDRFNKGDSNSYVITAMDFETFGHHRPGLEHTLFDIINNDNFENILVSEIDNYVENKKEVFPKDSSWASSIEDVRNGNPFNLWSHPENKLHRYEWELLTIAVRSVHDSEYNDEKMPEFIGEHGVDVLLNDEQRHANHMKSRWFTARDLLDKGLNSDPMWWSSARPWWSVEMIEKGVYAYLDIINTVPDSNHDDRERAYDLYVKIVTTSHQWQRNSIVDLYAKEDRDERKIPISKEFNKKAEYKALIDVMKNEEEGSALRREYEMAIKWRDSIYKVENDLDIYEAVGMIQQLRESGKFERFNDLLKEYKEKYRLISSGQPE